jgi:hypothetical protein
LVARLGDDRRSDAERDVVVGFVVVLPVDFDGDGNVDLGAPP